MTKSQALAEARRRWGAEAFAYEPDDWSPRYRAGYPPPSLQFIPFTAGNSFWGNSWEAVFEDAERRITNDKA